MRLRDGTFMMALSKARSDPDAIERMRNPPAWLKTTRNMVSGVLKTGGVPVPVPPGERDRIRENLFPEPEAGSARDPRLSGFWRLLREC